MKIDSIRNHLKDHSIYSGRKSSINNAFASALSVADAYDHGKIESAIISLGLDPNDLKCIYCKNNAQTWDHIICLVKDGQYSGYGHQIGNLIPCCTACNSSKTNKDWKVFLASKTSSDGEYQELKEKIESYIKLNTLEFQSLLDDKIRTEMEKLEKIKLSIHALLQKGDKQAEIIRKKLRKKIG